MSELSSKLANLNPFKSRGVDDEDLGGAMGIDSVAGGGRSAKRSGQVKSNLRVSDVLKSFLVHNKVISEADANKKDGMQQLLGQSVYEAPIELLNRSNPLPDYFVSSSHNTYLMAHQLYGKSSAAAYETALKTGSRCVEIDAWDNSDNKEEPKVTHGYTLVSHIPFRKVCETIRDVFDEESAQAQKMNYIPGPIMLSLENHCGAEGQKRLVDIMTEVFDDRMLSKAVREHGHQEQEGHEGPGEHVTLAELGFKIVVIVEHHLSDEAQDDSDSSSDEEEDADDERNARKEYKDRKKTEESSPIIPELAALGVYAQSVKPRDNSWYDPGHLTNGPHHHLINVSETGLLKHFPDQRVPISTHNSKHLMRVFPKGTRISSSNLKPVRFWGIGAQICALNWQTFALSNQLNDALFAGSEGYILKPAALRQGGSGDIATGKKKKLLLHVAGATDIPLHEDREAHTMKPYLTCTLYSPLRTGDVPKRKTSPYKHHKLGFMHSGENPPATDPIWDETLEWEYDESELVFVRMLIKSDDSWAKNPMFAAAAVRLDYITPGWKFFRLMDMQGRETKCTVLLNFETVDA